MTGELEPPRLARTFLRLVVHEDEREVAEGELEEGYRRRAEDAGRLVAGRWYRRQVWGYAWRALRIRSLTARREEGRMSRLDDLGRDVRFALRGLVRRPTFTAVAVTTLALGIGSNSAIFTLVGAYFFEPLPYDHPDELVLIWETKRNTQDVTTVSPGNFWTWKDEAESFADIAGYNVDFATLSGDGPAERVTSSVVAPNFFHVLGAEPLVGTGFSEASVREGGPDQVVLSHSLWVRRFGSDRSLVGRDIRIDGRPYRVVGVMPPSYRQPERSLSWQTPELWRPLMLEDQRGDFGSRYLRTIARLKPGVSVEQARAEMDAMAVRMARSQPESNAGRSILVRTLDEYLMADARPTLMILLIAGAAVLLIVCANVANLTLARGEERRRELALRAALGSGAGRLVRQIVVEGILLALIGAAVGTIGVYAASGLLQSIQTRFFSGLVDVSVDLRVITWTTLLAVGAGALFGIPLARMASQPSLNRALVEGGERAGGGSSDATRSLLIVGQVGMATSLLVVALLLWRSFAALVAVPPGFDAEGVVTVTVTPPRATYQTSEEVVRYHRELLAEIEAIPGVVEVGPISDLMFTTENMFTTFAIDGREYDPEAPPTAEFHIAFPGYFDVLRIPVREGALPVRWPEGDEVPVVVNETMAAKFWPGGDAVGAGMSLEGDGDSTLRVVAVVGDILDDGFDATADPVFYLPFGMSPSRRMSYVIRTNGDTAPVMASVRAAVARIDPDVPAGDLRPLDEMMAETVVRPRAASLIGLTLACLALLVAAVGIYGVLSYSVQRQTREIGIRSALGARGSDLVAMVIGRSTRLVVVGLALGTVGAVAAGRALAGLLFGVRAWDPPSLLGAVAVLGVVATLAAWLPARRAVGIDPREALRAD